MLPARPWLLGLLGLTALGCPNTNTATDAAADGPAEDSNRCEGERDPTVRTDLDRLFLAPGATAEVTVQLSRDRCAAVDLPVRAEAPQVATAGPAVLRVPPGASVGRVTVTAVAAGTTTVRVGEARVAVTVRAPALPECLPETRPLPRLMPGGTARGVPGSFTELASVSVPAGAREVPAMDVLLSCAPDQTPEGFTAVGPAVLFGPTSFRTVRELTFTLPANPARVPPGYELHVELAYKGPGERTSRVVPVANAHFTTDGRAVTFQAPRFGSWQAVLRQGVGTRRVQRRFTFHAILGVSMGAAGASMIGARNPERFDFIAPLGGPVDWSYLGNYIQRYHVGGFCTAQERARDPEGCARGASVERTPEARELFERRQHFEDWYYPDGEGGQGGTFDRHSYIQIFRDLTRMFGNAVTAPGMTGVLPRGVPDGEAMRSDADRCARPVTLMNYYDDEYNPDGSLPVITFCDGQHAPGRLGRWDGSAGNFPMEVALAVDVNRNGRRDPGEPVVRNFHEPFRDTGPDGVPSTMEPGYDARSNPDPAGDDYDRQFNPGGLEGNFVHDAMEPYDDVGVDGVRCPGTCPYDQGEGNGRYDAAPGWQRFQEVNPRGLVARMPPDALRRLDFFVDGGVRDLFGFGADANHFVGAFAQRGEPLHYYNNFAPFGAERVPEDPFPYNDIDWARVPGRVMVRYGNIDATPAQLIDGDGHHVGTLVQIQNRLFSSLWYMQARWPGGDRSVQNFSSDVDNAGRCASGYFCTFDFRSDRARRTGPVSIYLPPGYHDPENAGVRYPVVFLLHGYGQQPQDLIASGLLLGNFMSSGTLPTWRKPQKFIMVFPDGRCRAQDGCLRGTFYTDSPVGNAQMETYFLDLYDFVDRTYRVRRPETLEVTE